MIKLLTDCDKCIHKRVCKKFRYPKQDMEILKSIVYDDWSNDKHVWGVVMESHRVDISFSCLDYQEQKPTPKGFA